MSGRQYGVYEVCPHEGFFVDGATGRLDGMKPHPLGVATGYNKGGGRTYEAWCPGAARLSSIPDALVEEAAKRVAPFVERSLVDVVNDDPGPLARTAARAALSVLFPGEEE